MSTHPDTAASPLTVDTHTHAVEIQAPAATAFAYLSDPRNLPKWAIHFCHGIEESPAGFHAETPQGRLLVRLDADASTGVVDTLAGPDEDHLLRYPSRVAPLGPDRCVYVLTAVRPEGLPDEAFAQMCAGMAEEFALLRRELEGQAR